MALELKATFAFIKKMEAILLTGNSSDEFMCLPLGLSFSKDELSFLSISNNTEEKILDHFRYEFSKLVNAIPKKNYGFQSDGSLMWNPYLEALDYAKVNVAQEYILTPTEENDFVAAKKTVYDDYENRVESSKRRDYRQYKSLYEDADRIFVQKSWEAENTDDQKVKDQWEKVDKHMLLKQKQSTMDDWKSKGFKEIIESALLTINKFEEKTPIKAFEAWKNKTLGIPAITSVSDGSPYYFTSFSPANIDESVWRKFTINRAEFDTALKKVPASLMDLLSSVADQAEFELESISLDYAVLSIYRPWLSEELFQSRIWRFNPSYTSSFLSDGIDISKGNLPAFITKIVLAKNIVINLKTNSTTNSSTIEKLKAKSLYFGSLVIRPVVQGIDTKKVTVLDNRVFQKTVPNSISLSRSSNIAISKFVFKKPSDQLPTRNPNYKNTLQDEVNRSRAKVIKANDIAGKIMLINKINTARIVWNRNMIVLQPSTIAMTQPVTISNKIGTTANISGYQLPKTATTSAVTGAQKETPPPPASEENLQVVAFICKMLPKSPNPDPGLRW